MHLQLGGQRLGAGDPVHASDPQAARLQSSAGGEDMGRTPRAGADRGGTAAEGSSESNRHGRWHPGAVGTGRTEPAGKFLARVMQLLGEAGSRSGRVRQAGYRRGYLVADNLPRGRCGKLVWMLPESWFRHCLSRGAKKGPDCAYAANTPGRQPPHHLTAAFGGAQSPPIAQNFPLPRPCSLPSL